MNFIILTYPRSGSTWLGEMIDSHSKTRVYGELFLNHDVPEKYQDLRKHDPEKFFRFKKSHSSLRPFSTFQYLDHVFGYEEDHKITARGLKLMAFPLLIHPEILLYCKTNKIKIIHLHRPVFERCISYILAEQKGVFHVENKETGNEKQTIDPDHFTRYLKQQAAREKWLYFYLKLTGQVLDIKYKDLRGKPNTELRKIYNFLNLDYEMPKSRFQKQITKSYAETIENYEDLIKSAKEENLGKYIPG